VRLPRLCVPFLLLGLLAPAPRASGPTAAEARERVRRQLETGCLAGARVAGYAALLEEGTELFALDPDRPMVPASTQKLLTGAAALRVLGPAHELETVFLATTPLDRKGVLKGDLVVVGGGAPDLTAAELWNAVRELHARGLRVVEGGLLGDDSAHAPPGRPRDWPGAKNHNPYNAPGGALGVNWNALRVDVRPGPSAGAPARAELYPLREVALLEVRAKTGGARPRIQVERRFAEGRNRIVVRGTLPPGAETVSDYVALEDPTGSFLLALRELLSLEGIEVKGELRRGPAPPEAVELYRHPSRPVAELVRAMLKYSNNQMAETLLRDTAALATGGPGSTEAGLAAVADMLGEWGVPSEGLVLADGSGHSRKNRLTTRALVELLRAAARDPLVGPELLAALPIAGEDGTLHSRPYPGGRGELRAKTGSLTGVHALAGHLRTSDGRRAVFALLAEDGGRCGYRPGAESLDRAAAAIARIPAPTD
jgi:D-alanyl-D-alanine carboxypeptidase/D-alanyl-D-alanine-endopeptidase (penicillin-binding protein 4)